MVLTVLLFILLSIEIVDSAPNHIGTAWSSTDMCDRTVINKRSGSLDGTCDIV